MGLSQFGILEADRPDANVSLPCHDCRDARCARRTIYGLTHVLMKGDNSNLSQKLMRWRIALQFLAILIILAYAFVSR